MEFADWRIYALFILFAVTIYINGQTTPAQVPTNAVDDVEKLLSTLLLLLHALQCKLTVPTWKLCSKTNAGEATQLH